MYGTCSNELSAVELVINHTQDPQPRKRGAYRQVCIAAAQVLCREAHQVPNSILVPAAACNPWLMDGQPPLPSAVHA